MPSIGYREPFGVTMATRVDTEIEAKIRGWARAANKPVGVVLRDVVRRGVRALDSDRTEARQRTAKSESATA